MYTDIGKSWKFVGDAAPRPFGIPEDAQEIDFPFDVLRYRNRNYAASMGAYGSYYDAVTADFYKVLPSLQKSEWIFLEIEGVCQAADVYVGGALAGHIEGVGKHFVDITPYYVYGARNVVCLHVWAPQMAGKYVGAGIAGGVRLHTHADPLAVREDGVYVISEVDGEKATVRVRVELTDRREVSPYTRKALSVEAILYNERGKKAARKVKKFRLRKTQVHTVTMPFRLSRFYPWTPEDPYRYTVKIVVRDSAGKVLDEAESGFGIVERALSPTRGLVLGDRAVKLRGVVVGADNGILGAESTREAEQFKLSRLREIGYNAVRYIGCPTEAALDTLDELGMYAVVDLFDVWAQGKFPYDGHVGFADRCISDCERFVCQLRKHPSVVMYGLCNDAEETYERGEGSRLTASLAAQVRALDASRPVAVCVRERVPSREELDAAGLKASRATDAATAVSMGREKDLFRTLTERSLARADLAGYAYLYPRYAEDRAAYPDRLIFGCAEYPARAFDALEASEKTSGILGEFLYCGADMLGYPYGKPEFADAPAQLLPPHASYCGDLDLICERKPEAAYHAILLGDRSVSQIVVTDPESEQIPDKAGNFLPQVHSLWNWPRSLGKPIDIQVYSGGEVVALYRDGKPLGRKIAGKGNKHIATFRTEFYPGKLEAVSYHKGRECSRTVLESVTSPRAVRLKCERKARRAGELLFVEIEVADKEGRVVPYASREVEITVTGDGELYALGSADRCSQHPTGGVQSCPVYDGKALAIIRAREGGEGKITVKATSDGLLSGKIALRVRG